MNPNRLTASEVDLEEGVCQINRCRYLFIDSIREIEELTLELLITEAKVQDEILAPGDLTAVEQLRAGAKPIRRDVTCRFFRLIFDAAVE
jgi:hypothetical protein